MVEPEISKWFALSLPELIEGRANVEEDIRIERSAEKPDRTVLKSLAKLRGEINKLIEIKNPVIHREALEIMEKGDPVNYIIETYNKLHVGDTALGMIMLLSIANQSVTSADGIQPKLTGASGKGKTHAAKAMFHLIPDLEYKMMGSLSAKTLFYKPDLMPGTIIFADDVKMSEDLDSTLKQAMSNFQEPTTHRTVINQGYSELIIPPRTVFWMTSVNTDFSDELINRLYDLNVDESSEIDKAVTDQRLMRAGKGDEALPVNEEVNICRAIIHMVKCRAFRVLIPYSKEIEWKGSKDRRNLNRFLDLLQGFAVLRFMQRPEVFDNEILASVKDFDDAKALYDATSQTQITKLTQAERRLAEWLVSKGEAKTINEIVNEYLKQDGSKYTYTAIYKWFKGIRGKGGLLDKVPGLLKTEKNGEEAFKLDRLEESAVGSIVSLAPEAYEKYRLA